MTSRQRCPVCGSDMVYGLMNTLRCKRCKEIWKAGEEDICWSDTSRPVPPAGRAEKIKKPLAHRLETKLEECLRRSGGRFCFETLHWQAGEISREIFGRYVRQCVKERTLAYEKDRYGRIWYGRSR